jgi:MoxR-like ATPase
MSLANPVGAANVQLSDQDVRAIDSLRESYARLCAELGKVIVGQREVIEQVAICLFARRHALLMGVPGLAKTLLVSKIAETMSLGFNRIQFTPDLMPMDITGTDILQENSDGRREFQFIRGPIFENIILADEINRAPPKTQAALLEAMQERQVSHGGVTRPLPRPFYVFATQNPIENEGTFPLPEAQLDRFLLNIEVPYPAFEAEVKVASLPATMEDLPAMATPETLMTSRQAVESVRMSQTLLEAIVRLVRETRPESTNLAITKEFLDFGASPRASQALALASKALALLRGESEVTWEHIRTIAPSVLRHRVVTGFRAHTARRGATSIVEEIIASTVL